MYALFAKTYLSENLGLLWYIPLSRGNFGQMKQTTPKINRKFDSNKSLVSFAKEVKQSLSSFSRMKLIKWSFEKLIEIMSQFTNYVINNSSK